MSAAEKTATSTKKEQAEKQGLIDINKDDSASIKHAIEKLVNIANL